MAETNCSVRGDLADLVEMDADKGVVRIIEKRERGGMINKE